MRRALTLSWWHLVVRGLAALLFGVLALLWPGLTLYFLVALFAAYLIVSGIASFASAARQQGERGWWLMLLLGVVSLVAAVAAIIYPGVTALVLIAIMGINAIFAGILDLVMAIRLRREIAGEWLLGVAGVISLAFGVLVLAYPGAGALALVWLIALYAIAVGVLLTALGLRLHSRHEQFLLAHE